MSFLMSNVLNAVAGILVAVSPNYISMLVFRAIFGFGAKGGWMSGYVLSKRLKRTHTLTQSHEFTFHSGVLSEILIYQALDSLSVKKLRKLYCLRPAHRQNITRHDATKFVR